MVEGRKGNQKGCALQALRRSLACSEAVTAATAGRRITCAPTTPTTSPSARHPTR